MGKDNDFTSGSLADADMVFSIYTNGLLTDIMRLSGNNGGVGIGNVGKYPSSHLSVGGGLVVGSAYATNATSALDGDVYIVGQLGVGTNQPNTLNIAHFKAAGGLNGAAMRVFLDGPTSFDVPSGINFGWGGNAFGFLQQAKNSNISNYGGGFTELYFSCSASGQGVNVRPGVIGFEADAVSDRNRESPQVIFKGQAVSLSAGFGLINQRQYIFQAPSINGVVGGAVESVSYAATVYIHGPPTGENITIVNSYALWLDEGNLRADGDIIGGAATSTKVPGVLFTTTAFGVSSNSTTENELIRGIVGTTSLLANTLSEGRTIRLKAWGYYNTQLVPDTLRMSVLLGTTTIMSTGAQTPAGSVSTGGWELKADITCQTTGGAGTVFGQGDFPHFTSAAVFLNWEMVNSSAITVNTTGANPIRILAQWGGANAANQIYCTNAIGEILN